MVHWGFEDRVKFPLDYTGPWFNLCSMQRRSVLPLCHFQEPAPLHHLLSTEDTVGLCKCQNIVQMFLSGLKCESSVVTWPELWAESQPQCVIVCMRVFVCRYEVNITSCDDLSIIQTAETGSFCPPLGRSYRGLLTCTERKKLNWWDQDAPARLGWLKNTTELCRTLQIMFTSENFIYNSKLFHRKHGEYLIW